ncbi:MAG: hypothetical protein AAF999_17330 [Pseudomonadota bacterium]
MKWVLHEILAPVARRAGGQTAAALVALGLAQEHESAVAAAIAWAIITAGEVSASARSRNALYLKARQALGRD